MRDILFRAKNEDDEWCKGSLRVKNIIGGIAYVIYPIVPPNVYTDGYRVDPETIGQYTGLTDKNGVKVFEGDIIRFYDETDGHEDGEIYWDNENSRFAVRWESDNVTEFDNFDAECSEVVGNIWGEATSGEVT